VSILLESLIAAAGRSFLLLAHKFVGNEFGRLSARRVSGMDATNQKTEPKKRAPDIIAYHRKTQLF